MVEIIKGRYGYRAEDGTIQVATKGTRLSLDRGEEKILVNKGCAVIVEEQKKEPVKAVKKETSEQSEAPSVPKTRKRKGRKA